MNPKRPRYVISDVDRHGKRRFYYRPSKDHQKIRLPGDPIDPRYKAAYEAARDGKAEDRAPYYKPPSRPQSQRRKRGGFVYFLRVGDTVKIGFSGDPLTRFNDLRTGLAKPITSIVMVHGDYHDERRLHHRFASVRLEGEWFRYTEAIRMVMAQAAAYGILPRKEAE